MIATKIIYNNNNNLLLLIKINDESYALSKK